MRVHVFESMTEPDLYGFTSDRSGNNLPPRGGMEVLQNDRYGSRRNPSALEAIEKDGFYLTTGQIRLEEREG